MPPSNDSSARPELLLDYAHATSQRSLSLRATAVRQLSDALALARRMCPTLAGLPSIDDDVNALLSDVVVLANRVEAVAQSFLRADGTVALLVPGGGHVLVPSAAVPGRAGAIRRLTEEDIRALGRWLLGAGVWGWQRRRYVLNLLGSRGPVQALLHQAVAPSPLVRVFGPAGDRFNIALGLTKILKDAKTLQDQGNPFRAFEERGSNYVADYQQLWLDTALVAFVRRPSPHTGAAAALLATSWAAWVTWDERRRAANRVIGAADRAQDRARDKAREGVHTATDTVRDWLKGSPGAPIAPFPLAESLLDAIDGAADAADSVGDAVARDVRGTVRRGQDVVGNVVEGGLDAGETIVDGATDLAARGLAEAKEHWPFGG